MTSGQYSYLLLRKLQIMWSSPDTVTRVYLYNFFGEIFNDPSVTVDETAYQNFVRIMDEQSDYAAKKNLYAPEQIYNDEKFNDNYIILQEAFLQIGIELTTDNPDGGSPSSLIFTLPSGTQKALTGLNNVMDNPYLSLRLRSRLGTTEDYYNRIKPYYTLEMEEKIDLKEIGTNTAGGNTRWIYNADTETLEISGVGELTSSQLWPKLGIDAISIIILGAGVTKLAQSSLNFSSLTLVDFHGENDELLFGGDTSTNDHFYGSAKTAHSWIVYSDNIALRNYPYDSNMTIEWHALSEWEG